MRSSPSTFTALGSVVPALELHSAGATLDLTVTVLGAAAFAPPTLLPVLSRRARLASRPRGLVPFFAVAYAQGVVMVVAFQLLSLLGFA